MMILLADSGSTKTDWCLISEGKSIVNITTKGINPFFQSQEQIEEIIKLFLIPYVKDYKIKKVYFYGAGCAFPEKNKIVASAISEYINCPIEVGSDLLAAAHSLCGHVPGIACILGTGSNSCYYDGKEIVKNVSPLGYILGDEGSGAVLGKTLLGDYLKNQLSPELQTRFSSQFPFSKEEILDKTYKQPFPNRFFASFSPFLHQHINEPEIYAIVYNGFKSFFIRNVMQYDYKNNQVHFTGSIAYYYQDILGKVANELNIRLGKITKSPMERLINYYTQSLSCGL